MSAGCTASTDSTKDGSDGKFYCINGGAIGGTAGSCTCTNCNVGYEGVSCQTKRACLADTNSSKTGADGIFYCINGGTVGGTAGACTCTCEAGYEGASCQTESACAASTDSTKDGSDGLFYCINGGNIGGTAGSCTCTSCDVGYQGASCQTSSTASEKEKAEGTRDTILNGIKDEMMKKKAKLLADAAINRQKVTKMSATLTASDAETACSDYYIKAKLDTSLGACVAEPFSRRRGRSLAATTYEISVFFSSDEIDDDTLTAAASALKAEGVTGVETKTNVDPIGELRTIDGVDAGILLTFSIEAGAAADAVPQSTPPPSQSPAPPQSLTSSVNVSSPPPPPEIIVLDDYDNFAVGISGDGQALFALACALLVLLQ
jgi:hypothetical protein